MRRRLAVLAATLAALLLPGCGTASYTLLQLDPGCRREPMANVYVPQRLSVLDECKRVSGTVLKITPEEDGDVHIDITPDPQFIALLNERNYSDIQGALVVEIVPADQPGCVPGQPPRLPQAGRDFGLCTGANLAAPPVGAHVTVTGPYVIDREHGWTEIHPVWDLKVG